MDNEADDQLGQSTGSAYDSSTFHRDVQIRVSATVGSASISPSGRDVVLASREGLQIIDLDSPYSPPRNLAHSSPWEVADVQWSPFPDRAHWVVSTSNQKALVWNLQLSTSRAPIEHTLHAHTRAITDINFSAHELDILATCAVDSYVHCWDLRNPARPVMTFADWHAGATQVKWNRQDQNIVASSHDRFLHIWDRRKGAYPLKTIEAHATKIYGLDWNRTRATGVLTCSLDRTIKMWDYTRGNDEPERVIRTDYPVWRARHTPFGWGVLAMPQRGNHDLHLYDRRLDEGTPEDGFIQPVHSFDGHEDQVKEFLWRSRGEVEEGIDNRDFQLISWGMDRTLRLHRMDAKYLRAIGYEKGKEVRKKLNFTRQGAKYITYREVNNEDAGQEVSGDSQPAVKQGLGALVSAAGMSKAPSTIDRPSLNSAAAESTMGMKGRAITKRAMNPVKWIQGVKMGRKRAETMEPFQHRPSMPKITATTSSADVPENLSDEITSVAKKFRKVSFEKADVHQRFATVGLYGPWGLDDKPAFIRIIMEFPQGYPSEAAPFCTLEKATSAIGDDTLKSLGAEVNAIANHFVSRKIGSLEAIITYLLGERSLEDSMTDPEIAMMVEAVVEEGDDTSSDEEEEGEGMPQGTAEDNADGLDRVSVLVRAPIAKGCGAYFAHDGRLVCFFPPKPEPKPLYNIDSIRLAEKGGRAHRHHEGLGRLFDESPLAKDRNAAMSDDDQGSSSPESWSSSSSSSSESDTSSEEFTRLPARLKPPNAAWRAAALRLNKTSSHSSSVLAKPAPEPKKRSVITIHDVSEHLPARKALAQEYKMYGDGPSICVHNALIARRHGFGDIALVWDLCVHLLYNQVPLEILETGTHREPMLVMAKRAMERTRNKHGGYTWRFNEPQSIINPQIMGRVKWGQHPFASSWLIAQIFDHFERLADIQMLAMLSCLFCEPTVEEDATTALVRCRPGELSMASEAPAFSVNYHSTIKVAESFITHISASGMPTPTAGDGRSGSDYFSKTVSFGSLGSSNEPWPNDVVISGPVTPFSTGNTPPALSRPITQHNSASVSLSTSPDIAYRAARRSASHISSAIASLSRSRPFSFTAASSPDERTTFDPTEYSTSSTNNVRWGVDTVIGSNSTPSPEKKRRPSRRRSSVFTSDSTYNSSEDEYVDLGSDDDTRKSGRATTQQQLKPVLRVKLKNQDQFAQGPFAAAPLLDANYTDRYAAYRELYAEQLGVWDLYMARAEVLKFNGLASPRPISLNAAAETTLPLPTIQLPDSPDKSEMFGRENDLQRTSLGSSPKKGADTASKPDVRISRGGRPMLETIRSNSSILNPTAKPFTPGTPNLNPVKVEEQQQSSTKTLPLCAICWQPAEGLLYFLDSGTGQVAHAGCVGDLEKYCVGESTDVMQGIASLAWPAISSLGSQVSVV